MSDRLPPHSDEAEAGALGCILLDPKEALPLAVESIPAPEIWYDMRHREIWLAVLKMWDRGRHIDTITLHQTLKDAGKDQSVGGLAYLSQLPDTVPGVGVLGHYLDILKEKYVLRQTIQVATAAVAEAYDEQRPAAQILEAFERSALAVGMTLHGAVDVTIREAVRECGTDIERYQERHGMLTGLPTGFIDFDKMTGGLQNGEVILIAARPSQGKSSLAMNIAEHNAVDNRLPVAVFSLEMTKKALIYRTICSRARVNSRNLREGFLAERDMPKLIGAMSKIHPSPLYIDETGDLTAMQLRARARRLQNTYGIRLIVIDYLQLLHGTGRYENRNAEMKDISSTIKKTAKELKVPIIAICQLSRAVEKERRKPRLSDLRESGDLEADADVVGLLYKPHRKDDDEDDGDAIPMNLDIAKQRNGPTGDVNLTFLRCFTRFESAAKITPDEPTDQTNLPYNDQ